MNNQNPEPLAETSVSSPERDKLAEEIIRRVVEGVVRCMWTRNIEPLQDDGDLDFPTEEELVIDALGLALGEDIGCLDEKDDDFRERVELLWLQDKLRSLSTELETAPTSPKGGFMNEDEKAVKDVYPHAYAYGHHIYSDGGYDKCIGDSWSDARSRLEPVDPIPPPKAAEEYEAKWIAPGIAVLECERDARLAAAQAEIEEKRKILSSMEVTLGNATSLAEFQAARIKELEDFNLKACDVVGKAEIRIATLEASGKWISVKQELPPNEDLVQTYGHTEHSLKCVGNEWRQEVARYLNNRFWTNSHIYVTHWQPLPAAPTDELLSPPPEVKEKI